jgi:hypothetical protein
MLQMMCAYIKLLMMLFGSACEHMANVTTIFFLVKDRMAMFEKISSHQVGNLLWAIFADARAYFSTPHDQMGNPPVSTLDWLIGAMRGGSLPSTLGTPIQSMFGSAGRVPAITQGQQHQDAEQEGPRYQRTSQGPNLSVHSKIEAATAEARRCVPNVDYRQVYAVAPTPKPRLSRLKLSQGGCFDHLFFGKCTNRACSFKHDGQLNEAKVDDTINVMRPALAKFVEVNSGQG